MSTEIRPEITEKSPWWIPRQRYYELKHFCLQYPEMKIMLRSIDGIQSQSPLGKIPKTKTNELFDPVGDEAAERASLSKRIEIIERAAREAGADLSNYILKGVTEGMPYSIIRLRVSIPCNRNEYYERYRRFFWILDKLRD